MAKAPALFAAAVLAFVAVYGALTALTYAERGTSRQASQEFVR